MKLSLRTFAALLFASTSLVMTAACGGGANPKTLEDCHALCDVEGKAPGCTQAAADNCKTLCDFFLPTISEECQIKAQGYYACAKSLDWHCSTGSDLAVSTDDKCDAEQQALMPCQQ